MINVSFFLTRVADLSPERGKMKFIGFEEAKDSDLESLFTREQMLLLKQQELKGGVCVMARQTVGAIAWQKKDDAGELRYLYVLPEARRLGAGSLLVESAVRQMRSAGLEEICFEYSDRFDRTSFTPFFNDIGYVTEDEEAMSTEDEGTITVAFCRQSILDM